MKNIKIEIANKCGERLANLQEQKPILSGMFIILQK